MTAEKTHGSLAPTDLRLILARTMRRQHARLIADDGGVDSIHWVRVASLEFGIAVGARHTQITHVAEAMQYRRVLRAGV